MSEDNGNSAINFSEQVKSIRDEFSQCRTSLGSADLKVRFLGKKGSLQGLYQGLRHVEDKKSAGQEIHQLKEFLEHEIQALEGQESAEHLKTLAAKKVDLSLPCQETVGSLHPVTLMKQLLIEKFERIGFSVKNGPEIDYDFFNFGALNFPDDHPARDMQDTFFTEDQMVLRTHTSNVQIHTMFTEPPPIRVVVPGRTYRHDSDATHTPMFHQLEALVVDEGISFADLKGFIQFLCASVFGSGCKTRLRPSFFPFTEPSAEVDVLFEYEKDGKKVSKWLEIGGSGMVHPNVFEACGIDSEKYTGFAFGFGIDRMAMLYFGLTDLRALFSGKVDLLERFPVHLNHVQAVTAG